MDGNAVVDKANAKAEDADVEMAKDVVDATVAATAAADATTVTAASPQSEEAKKTEGAVEAKVEDEAKVETAPETKVGAVAASEDVVQMNRAKRKRVSEDGTSVAVGMMAKAAETIEGLKVSAASKEKQIGDMEAQLSALRKEKEALVEAAAAAKKLAEDATNAATSPSTDAMKEIGNRAFCATVDNALAVLCASASASGQGAVDPAFVKRLRNIPETSPGVVSTMFEFASMVAKMGAVQATQASAALTAGAGAGTGAGAGAGASASAGVDAKDKGTVVAASAGKTAEGRGMLTESEAIDRLQKAMNNSSRNTVFMPHYEQPSHVHFNSQARRYERRVGGVVDAAAASSAELTMEQVEKNLSEAWAAVATE